MRKLNECLDFDNRKNDSEKLETAKNYTLSRLMFKYFFFFKVKCRSRKDKIWRSSSIRRSSSGILSSSFSSGRVLKSLSRPPPLLRRTLMLSWVTGSCLKILQKAAAFYTVSWFQPLWTTCFSSSGLLLPSKLSYR